jgi:hypothetical protein
MSLDDKLNYTKYDPYEGMTWLFQWFVSEDLSDSNSSKNYY